MIIPGRLDGMILFFLQYGEPSHFDKVLAPLLELQERQHKTMLLSQIFRSSLSICSHVALSRGFTLKEVLQ
jgi:hypothetical protein